MRSGRRIDAPSAGGRWYRQPVIWLGALILLASLAGVAVTFVAARRFPDEPLTVGGEHVLTTPVDRAGAAAPATGTSPAAPEPSPAPVPTE